ncbi:MAG: septal ring lytic transglycosylase RlpA family protein [Gammaproteobacteria bacterium]|nr:septal ring lytic transglycosylase RlpA family protein [Gammaproteobacteria bacterium]
MKQRYAAGALVYWVALLGGCSTWYDETDHGPDTAPDVSAIRDPVPRAEPKSKYGNPKSYVVHGRRYFTLDSADGFVERGIASWYGRKFHGRRTSSGETYDMYAMTAAHKALPLPTYVRVTNLDNGRSVILRVNDRGPFHRGRVIDVSYTAALKMDMVRQGTAPVEVRALKPGAPVRAARHEPGAIYVQVGAFAKEINARRIEQRLRSEFPQPIQIREVRIRQAKTGVRSLYRVWIGPLETMAAANGTREKLFRLGVEGAELVVDRDS